MIEKKKRNMELSEPWDTLYRKGEQHGGLGASVSAALYWYWAELSPAEREVARERVAELDGRPVEEVQGRFRPGQHSVSMVLGLQMLQRELADWSAPQAEHARRRVETLLSLAIHSVAGYVRSPESLDAALAAGLGDVSAADPGQPPARRGKGGGNKKAG